MLWAEQTAECYQVGVQVGGKERNGKRFFLFGAGKMSNKVGEGERKDGARS